MLAIATLLYNAEYLPGALVLGHALRKITPTNVKLIILIEKAVFEKWQLELLEELWDELIETQISESLLRGKLENDLKRPELAKTYTKIELWKLPYEKVLYLDADVLPLEGQNIVTDLLKLDFPPGKILAAPDSGFPDIFNSGVFVLAPNPQDYRNLLELVSSNNKEVSFDGADQGLLNQYFNSDPDWVSKLLQSGNTSVDSDSRIQHSNWIRIPFLYNTTPNAQYQYYPALNHFGYPKPSLGGPNEMGQMSRGLNNLSLQNPGNTTVFPYGNLALDHFSTSGSRSQVSVLHFIGASKPWNNVSSPTFAKWWLQWYEYSGGKLVDIVLRRQRYPISINRLNPPTTIPKQVSSPKELCDPSNYQHLTYQSGSSALFWDATKNSPPLDISNTTSLGSFKKIYKNDWDEFVHLEQVQREQALTSSEVSRIFEPPSSSHRSQGTLNNSLEFGVHQEQIAERVFDERSDYTPHHPLMMTDRNSLIGETQADAEKSNKFTKGPGNTDSKFKENGSSLHGTNQGFSGTEFQKAESKVFPWEHRQVQPERVWDEET